MTRVMLRIALDHDGERRKRVRSARSPRADPTASGGISALPQDPAGCCPLGKRSRTVSTSSQKAARTQGDLRDFRSIFQVPLGGPSGLYLGWCVRMRPQPGEVQAGSHPGAERD
ncbi:TPA: hypothetical protein BOS_20377 [Bos taurus]|nr:TPA: hypothetical protein BOS_20377 [Bos taurus]